MNTIEHLSQMESQLNQGLKSTQILQSALDDCEDSLPGLRQLFAYYGSDAWYQHLELEKAGQIPPHQPRGVLSEDGVYNLILECREIAEQLRQLADQLDSAIDQEE
ncbi:DUF4298 domain-containing protein [Streptococcus caprae]|uniref:DUF4298 domain-containing protein n=1 Tax=Streptococcus caprae TaxID=1640501 RepID=A0ABV8CVF1_9STRE